MNNWVNYHHLFYFKAIAEEGSVSKAAEKLRLGQPTLSAQLKQFEESLNVQLFERQHKKLILTEQGKLALDYARSIFQLGSEMLEVLHDRHIPQKLSLHIGSLDSVAKQITLQLVKQAFKIMPCQISLSEGKMDELTRELVAHRLDILVTNYLPTEASTRRLFHRVISHRPVSIYGAPRFRGFKKDFPKSISGQPMILPTFDSKLRYELDHWRNIYKIDFDVISESQDIAVKKLMAIEGLGLMPAANHTVMRQVLSGELIELGVLEGVYEDLLLVSAERRIENSVAARLYKDFSI
jgi:LysR family transcriptional activator of nhaA